MLETYRAVIRGDKIEWTDDVPPLSDQPITVHVTMIEPAELPTPAMRQAALEAMERLAERGTAFSDVPDPVAWQREVRKDRPLPGRD